jgi:hypothetical protein
MKMPGIALLSLAFFGLAGAGSGCSNSTDAVPGVVDLNYCSDQAKPACSAATAGYAEYAELSFVEVNAAGQAGGGSFCQLTYRKKLPAPNKMALYLSKDQDYHGSLIKEGANSVLSGSDWERTLNLDCPALGTKVFARVCIAFDASESEQCTQTHAFTLNGNEGRNVTVLAMPSKTLVSPATFGLDLKYSCPTKILTINNISAFDVMFSIEDPQIIQSEKEHGKTLISAGGSVFFPDDWKEGDTTLVRLWRAAGDETWPQSIVDAYLKLVSCEAGFEVVQSRNIGASIVQLPALLGVTSQLYAGISSGNYFLGDQIQVINGGAESYCYDLYELTDPDGNGVFAWGEGQSDLSCINVGESGVMKSRWSFGKNLGDGTYGIVLDHVYLSFAQSTVFTMKKSTSGDEKMVSAIVTPVDAANYPH